MKDSTSKKCFLVTAMCGHVGRKKYIPKNFAVIASDAKEASQLVKVFPRVKKHRKDAILNCSEITYEQYLVQRDTNRRDPYLNAKCHADVDMDENFVGTIQAVPERRRKEIKPLSMKYREWKAIGRSLARCHIEEY